MVDDVDSEYDKMKETDITIVSPIADHDWGDRSFTVKYPLGNILYIYFPRKLSEEYRKAVK